MSMLDRYRKRSAGAAGAAGAALVISYLPGSTVPPLYRTIKLLLYLRFYVRESTVRALHLPSLPLSTLSADSAILRNM